MVLIGQSIQSYEGLGCEHLVRFANLLGLEACELNPKGTSFKNIDKIINELGKMKTTYHLPVEGIEGYDFAYPDREEEIGDIIKLINKHSDDLQLILGVFHPVEEKGNFETLVENLRQLNIELVVENIVNYSDEEFMNLYTKFKDELGDQLKGWLFDVAHSYLRNGPKDYMNLLDKMPYDELEEIHLSDCTKNEDSHYSFGAGIMPIEEILGEIRRRRFNKIIVNETYAYPSVWSTIDSYRKVARYFKKPLYLKVTTRKLVFKPILKGKLRKANIV